MHAWGSRDAKPLPSLVCFRCVLGVDISSVSARRDGYLAGLLVFVHVKSVLSALRGCST